MTVMTNLGFRLAMADAGHRGRARPRSATATCSRRSRPPAARSAASSPATSCWPTWPPPATACWPAPQLLDLLVRSGRPLSELAAAAMTQLPQVLVNVQVAERRADIAEAMAAEIAAEEAALGGRGRVLVRAERHRAARAGHGRGRVAGHGRGVADRLAEVARTLCGG